MSVSYKFLTGALQDWTLGCWQEREESVKQLNHEKKYVYPLTKTWTLHPLKATGFHFLFTVSLNQMLILANKGNDHQFNKLLIVKQILLVSPIGNIKRTEKRIWILQLGLRRRGKKPTDHYAEKLWKRHLITGRRWRTLRPSRVVTITDKLANRKGTSCYK